jgi:hypothetical protein
MTLRRTGRAGTLPPDRNTTNRVRIGAGAGFSGDRIEPAVVLAERGNIDFLVFECLAERTMALAQQEKLKDPDLGFDPRLLERMRTLLALCHLERIRIVTNAGAANPRAAARAILSLARELGLAGLKVAAVTGDDVLGHVRENLTAYGTAHPALAAIEARIVSANAYLGADPIVQALDGGADVVVTGRVADPSLFLAPLVHRFRWPMSDWPRLGRGILVGHLLECAGQLTGGYFADPPYNIVPGMADLGFPIAEVTADGMATFSKVAGTGGLLSVATCTEQLLYEVHDPAAYLTPDVTADFSAVRFTQTEANVIQAEGAAGRPRPKHLKVMVAYRDGYIGEGQLSYAGPGAETRARLAGEIVRDRLRSAGLQDSELRCELIGLDSIARTPQQRPTVAPREVRLRVAGRVPDPRAADRIGGEVEALYTNGPAAGGGAFKSVREVIGLLPISIPRRAVRPLVTIETT